MLTVGIEVLACVEEVAYLYENVRSWNQGSWCGEGREMADRDEDNEEEEEVQIKGHRK